jgi:hypothetical protein
MICRSCTAKYSKTDRNKLLPAHSNHFNSDRCIDCLIEKLSNRQSIAYWKLTEHVQMHKELKQAYHQSSKDLTKLNTSHKQLDYDKNLILFNIHQNKLKQLETTKRRQSTKTTKPTKKATPEEMKAMLAQLSPEQLQTFLNDLVA